jgi:thymidylate synthase (FAD)
MTTTARIIATTQPVVDDIPNAEALIAYCARASNPSNQGNHETGAGLLRYCIRNRHWSVFQMANAVLEITGPRDITRQFLRHESIRIEEGEAGEYHERHVGFDQRDGGIQEFSQRYAAVPGFCDREARRQDDENRQASHDDLSDEVRAGFAEGVRRVRTVAAFVYGHAIDAGIAKECARVVLPEGLTMSRLYANGTLRSWLHFIDVRKGNGTQAEHVELAEACRAALAPHFALMFQATE